VKNRVDGRIKVSTAGQLKRMETVPITAPKGGSGMMKAIESNHPEPNVGRVFGVITLLFTMVFLVRSFMDGEISRSIWFLLPGLLITSCYWRRNLKLVIGLWLVVGCE